MMATLSLFVARAEALAVSSCSTRQPLDRAAADDAIRTSVLAHHGVRGCAAELAREFGDHPELAAARMRWARHAIETIYSKAS